MSAEKPKEARELDCKGASRGVWLVKVPKYLSEKWKEVDGGQVGRLRIAKPRFAGGKPEVMFTLSESLAQKNDVPQDHKFVLTGIANQNLTVVTEGIQDKEIAINGKVIQRAECRPIGDSKYMMLKKAQIELTNKPQKEVVHLKTHVQKYKPVSNHKFIIDHEKRKKEQGNKSRLPKERVQELLFAAFEKHQYYNLKDLVSVTMQPVTYLKEVLKELCVYNTKAPHNHMWELKPEYRHYKTEDT